MIAKFPWMSAPSCSETLNSFSNLLSTSLLSLLRTMPSSVFVFLRVGSPDSFSDPLSRPSDSGWKVWERYHRSFPQQGRKKPLWGGQPRLWLNFGPEWQIAFSLWGMAGFCSSFHDHCFLWSVRASRRCFFALLIQFCIMFKWLCGIFSPRDGLLYACFVWSSRKFLVPVAQTDV